MWKVLGHNDLLFYNKINKKYQNFSQICFSGFSKGSMFKFYSTK